MKQKKSTLLIVEDNQDDALFLRAAFQSLSTRYQIHRVENGDHALAYLLGEGKYSDRAQFPFPSFLITDLNMSPGDGFQVLDFLKLHPALSVIPVVMLSSSNDPDDIRTAYLLGASSYFVKPTSMQALRAIVKKIHEYWSDCEIPEVDESGFALYTESKGRVGARFPKPKR